jgi:hypothetical protein
MNTDEPDKGFGGNGLTVILRSEDSGTYASSPRFFACAESPRSFAFVRHCLPAQDDMLAVIAEAPHVSIRAICGGCVFPSLAPRSEVQSPS